LPAKCPWHQVSFLRAIPHTSILLSLRYFPIPQNCKKPLPFNLKLILFHPGLLFLKCPGTSTRPEDPLAFFLAFPSRIASPIPTCFFAFLSFHFPLYSPRVAQTPIYGTSPFKIFRPPPLSYAFRLLLFPFLGVTTRNRLKFFFPFLLLVVWSS